MTSPAIRSRFAAGIVCAVIVCCVAIAHDAQSASLMVSGTTILSAPATYDSVVVLSTGTLIADSALTSLGTMRVDSGGQVRHSGYPTNSGQGLVLNVAGTLTVRGTIDVTGLGLRGGYNGSAFITFGETYDTLGNIVSGAEPGAGGSYGGLAVTPWSNVVGSTNLAYGLVENPDQFGSGGGSNCVVGSNGGGLIHIEAGVLVVDGEILADGSKGNNCDAGGGSGPGSGGSIWISCDTLRGVGHIYARGGSATQPYPTSGGGGRIAAYVNAMSGISVDQISARGGQPNKPGGAGTIFIRPSRTDSGTLGDLIIDNNGLATNGWAPLRTHVAAFENLLVRNRGALGVDREIQVLKDFLVSQDGRLERH